MIAAPAPIAISGPKRRVTRPESGASRPKATADGAIHRPACSASSPSP